MEEKEFTLKDLGKYAESLAEMVFAQHDKLEERLSVQDVQFRRLWDAYKSIGITDPDCFDHFIQPIREKMWEANKDTPYWEKYKQTNGELDRLVGLLKDQNNSLKVLKETEKVIVDLVTLLNYQWEVLVRKLESTTKQTELSRRNELAKVDEFLALVPTLDNSPLAMEIRKNYAWEKEQLILEQIDLFGYEQTILTQMEFVVDERDRIFPISEGLFLK